MTLSLMTAANVDPQPTPDANWTGLTDDDASRIDAAIAATHAGATRTAYAQAWRHWARWCDGRGCSSLPAEPAVVCAYLGIQGLQPISGTSISNIVKDRAAATGLSAEQITAHSLRAGHATSAALAGVSVERVAAQTRHRRLDVLIERYIRPVQALQTTSSRDLGL